MAQPEDDSPEINPEEANKIQQVVGTFLYYAHAVDPKMIVSQNKIAAKQSKSTQETAKRFLQLLNYMSTHPDVITIYHVSRIK